MATYTNWMQPQPGGPPGMGGDTGGQQMAPPQPGAYFGTGMRDSPTPMAMGMMNAPVQQPRFASELRRVVRPGGVVILFEHNPYNPLTRRAVSNCPFDADAVLLSMKTAKEHLQQAGMTILEGRYILSVPSIDGMARRVDDALGSLPTGAQYYVAARR